MRESELSYLIETLELEYEPCMADIEALAEYEKQGQAIEPALVRLNKYGRKPKPKPLAYRRT